MNASATLLISLILVATTSMAQPQQDPHTAQDHSEHSPHDARDVPTESELRHVPPEPPARPMGDMSNERMIELMGMDDTAAFTMLSADQLEWRVSDGEDAIGWEVHAWFGNDYNKLWFKNEGESVDGEYASRSELLWDRIVSRWWNLQAGVRHDVSEGPSRTWAAFGVQGLAPYWFEIEATAYVGEAGRTALRLSGEYDLLLTQRLILQPEVELNVYGEDDLPNRIGSGLSDVEVGLRLRYEIRRWFAPYIGVAWTRRFGETADLAGNESESMYVAGVRVWF